MQAHSIKSNQIVQHPPLPPNHKIQSNLLTPRELYLSRANSNSKSFKKTSIQKSTKQKEFQKQIKYANPYKIDASFQRSLVHSENNLGLIITHGPFQETTTTLNQIKTRSKSKKCIERQEKKVEKIDSTRPFDVFSGVSACNQHKNRDKNDQYYLYWKSKAHEYLELNMKLMEDIRRLTKQNQHLKFYIQNLQNNNKSTLIIQSNSSQILKKSMKKEQSSQSTHLLQKLGQLQRELKKKEIVIKTYQQKIVDLNNKVFGDNQRTKLINKLKSEIDTLRTQINTRIRNGRKIYTSGQESTIQQKYSTFSWKEQLKSSNFGRK